MKSELDCKYEIDIEVSDLNQDNVLKPYGYQKIFAKIAEQHLDNIDLNIDVTMKNNLAWALVSLSVEIIQPVIGCMKLYAKTWFSQKKGPFYRREFLFEDSKGDVLFKGATYSVLLDVKKRKIYRSNDLPFFISEPIEEFTIEAKPKFKTLTEFVNIEDRKVYNSYIDRLGHVNNMRYGEFAYDAFTDEEKNNLRNLKRMDVFFLNELLDNDLFSILKGQDGNKIIFRGYNKSRDNIAFNIVIQF